MLSFDESEELRDESERRPFDGVAMRESRAARAGEPAEHLA